MAAAGVGGAAAAAAPALAAPAVPHIFRRVTLPGVDNSLDYLAVDVATDVVRGLPMLGWIDSSSMIAGTRAAPALSIAGGICRPAFVEDTGSALGAAMLALSEITSMFALA